MHTCAGSNKDQERASDTPGVGVRVIVSCPTVGAGNQNQVLGEHSKALNR